MSPFLVAVILSTVALSAVAQFALKVGMSSPHVAASAGGTAMILAAAASPFVWIGLAIYGASVVAWLLVLSKTDVSLAYPFVGVSFNRQDYGVTNGWISQAALAPDTSGTGAAQNCEVPR